MLSAYALSINSGSYSLFCKKEKPAGFSFLLFHEKDRKEKLLQLHFVRQPFPFLLPFGDIFPRPGEVGPLGGASARPQRRAFAESGAVNAVFLYDPICEKAIQENPQIFLNCNYKINFPLNMPRARRRAFKIVPA